MLVSSNKKLISTLLTWMLFFSCTEKPLDARKKNFPKKETKALHLPNKTDVWVYILAGQSNMAGRGLVEPQDTVPSKKILTVNQHDSIVYAKEPLHFYEPLLSGLDIGLSFGKQLLSKKSDSISILLIPCAIGGSSIDQWLGNHTHRNVQLYSNFEEKLALGKKYGTIKGILWHQGESDANQTNNLNQYGKKLSSLISKFRKTAEDSNLFVYLGELGSYSQNQERWDQINMHIHQYANTDNRVKVIYTGDLKDKGDNIHFNSESIRILGERYANKVLQ